ncbi:MAG TPA: acyltransferase family protein, partial [Myxococcota bacterium]
MSAVGGSRDRLPLVDGMRGVASVLVLAFHVYKTTLLPFAAEPFAQPLDFLLRQSYAGVDIFFVLSGYVIALSLSDQPLTLAFLGRFALRR